MFSSFKADFPARKTTDPIIDIQAGLNNNESNQSTLKAK